MSIVEITKLDLLAAPHGNAAEVLSDIVTTHHGSTPFVLGANVQEPRSIQIVSQSTTATARNLLQDLENADVKVSGSKNFHVSFQESPFHKGRYIDANVVEYVQNYFPASKATPDFKAQIEADFARFYEPNRDAPGSRGLVHGWTTDEVTHPDIEGEKAVCFIVLRGWENLESFQGGLEDEAFKQGIAILFA